MTYKVSSGTLNLYLLTQVLSISDIAVLSRLMTFVVCLQQDIRCCRSVRTSEFVLADYFLHSLTH